jgi:hypothetical protein
MRRLVSSFFCWAGTRHGEIDNGTIMLGSEDIFLGDMLMQGNQSRENAARKLVHTEDIWTNIDKWRGKQEND